MVVFSRLMCPNPLTLRGTLRPVHPQNFAIRMTGHSHWPHKEVEEFGHNYKFTPKHAEKVASFWIKVFWFVMVPGLAVSAYLAWQAYQKEWEHIKHRKQEDYIPYPYLANRYKPFPWGDGNKTFFHNPYTNWLPGVGYEKLMSEEDGKKH